MKNFLLIVLFLVGSFYAISQNTYEVDSIVKAYRVRITQNGGVLNSSAYKAIANFIVAAKNHKYWNKLLDIGPLCGDNLKAALVKL